MIGVAKLLGGVRALHESGGVIVATSSLSGVTAAKGNAAGGTAFGPTGDRQTFVVPYGVTTIYVQCWGAKGGDGGGMYKDGAAPLPVNVVGEWTYGGWGAYATKAVTVTPGDVMFVRVGTAGYDTPNRGQIGNPGGFQFVLPGGFNGGGDGYAWQEPYNYSGGTSGGGATDLRTAADTLASRVVVAGGGGGAAIDGAGESAPSDYAQNGRGGYGGAVGHVGGSRLVIGGTGGGGGTGSAGGTAGLGGTAGALGQGGTGVPSTSPYTVGGGGGLYGGGGSSTNANVGAGGGSSLGDTIIDNYQNGHGYMLITWNAG